MPPTPSPKSMSSAEVLWLLSRHLQRAQSAQQGGEEGAEGEGGPQPPDPSHLQTRGQQAPVVSSAQVDAAAALLAAAAAGHRFPMRGQTGDMPREPGRLPAPTMGSAGPAAGAGPSLAAVHASGRQGSLEAPGPGQRSPSATAAASNALRRLSEDIKGCVVGPTPICAYIPTPCYLSFRQWHRAEVALRVTLARP